MIRVSWITNAKVSWQLEKLFRKKYDRYAVFLQKPQFDIEVDAVRGDALYSLVKMYELYNSDKKACEVLLDCIEVALSTQAGRYYFLDDLTKIADKYSITWEAVGG